MYIHLKKDSQLKERPLSGGLIKNDGQRLSAGRIRIEFLRYEGGTSLVIPTWNGLLLLANEI